MLCDDFNKINTLDFSAFSYKKVSDQRLQYIEETGHTFFGEHPEKEEMLQLETVNKDNHQRLHKILMEECAFRDIETPKLYIDHANKDEPYAGATKMTYSIRITPPLVSMCDDVELRAALAHEVRHLFQDGYAPSESDELYDLKEYDADAAAVQSAGIDAVISLRQKMQKYLEENVHKYGTTDQQPPLENRILAAQKEDARLQTLEHN